jgi:hypothetical protein
MTSPNEQRAIEALRAAERALATASIGPVRLELDAELGGSERSHVFRFRVGDGPPQAPRSVIAKRAAIGEDEIYDPDASGFPAPAWRLYNDWAGLQFLTQVAADTPLAPRFYAGDRAAGLIVIEDLGAGDTLADLLLGADSEGAELRAIEFSALLGRMHGLTAGKQAEFDRLRDGLAPRDKATDHYSFQWLATALHRAADMLDVVVAPEVDRELAVLIAAIREPGPFLAYTHGDPCPDNIVHGSAGLQLLDFEFGDFRHALVDGVYSRILFPTCWSVNRLPSRIMRDMEHAYRAELSKGCSAATDDSAFSRAVVEGCAYWALTMFDWYSVPQLLGESIEWGIATVQQRVLARADLLARTTEEFGYLEGLGATFRTIAARLRARLPIDADAMPLYPAFR